MIKPVLSIILFLTCISSFSETQKRVDILTGHHSLVDGPNCWNSALYAKGLVHGTFHLQEKDFQKTIKKYCKKIATSQRRAGDIVVFRTTSSEGKMMELHASFLTSKNSVFDKADTQKSSSYKQMSLQRLHDYWSGQLPGQDPIEDAYNYYSDFYRCQRPRQTKMNKIMMQIEMHFSYFSFTRMSEQEKNQRLYKVNFLVNSLEKESKRFRNILSRHRVKQRIESYRTQLNLIEWGLREQ